MTTPTAVRATAPGKVMLAGEYAVLDGGRAIVGAVDRRVVATIAPPGGRDVGPPSPFLVAARAVVADQLGDDVAAAFARLTVDSEALRDGARKLGLGSSAATTVAAIAAALATAPAGVVGDDDDERRALIGRLAALAHAAAQGAKGAPGSGADVAASTWGGVIDFRRDAPPAPCRLPADLRLTFAWTGQPADTATLVAAVRAGQRTRPAGTGRALAAIAQAADALADAVTAAAAIEAIAAGGRAMTALATVTAVALVPSSVATLAARLAPLGAAVKTTGAGGGDIVLIAAPAVIDPAAVAAAIVASRLSPLALALDPRGVTLERDATP